MFEPLARGGFRDCTLKAEVSDDRRKMNSRGRKKKREGDVNVRAAAAVRT